MFRERTGRKKKQPEKTSEGLRVFVIVAIVAMLALPFLFLKRHFSLTQHPGWNPTEVQVLGTRIVTAYATDGGQFHPAVFYYRAEAEVQYKVDGQQFDVWLPASRPTSNRLELGMWLSDKKGRFATVFWDPKVPGHGEVKLKSDIGSNFADFD